jgi:hypothetical protein
MEVMLALVIIIMILGTVYSFYHSSAKLTMAGRQKIEDSQLARVVLFKIASELRGVTSSGSRFTAVLTGDEDNVNFVTTAIPSRLVFFPQNVTEKGRPIEHDLRLVEYSLGRGEEKEDEILGLQRDELRCLLTPLIEKKSSEELSEQDIEAAAEEQNKFRVDLGMNSNQAVSEQPLIKQMIISDRIKYLRFDYYDGRQWLSFWNPTRRDAIPRAVRVTIGFSEIPKEEYEQERLLTPDERPWRDDQYSLLISLILADDLKAEYAEQMEEQSE